jgi:hypothetical protein
MIVPSGNMRPKTGNRRVLGYAIGFALALVAVVWRLIRYSH